MSLKYAYVQYCLFTVQHYCKVQKQTTVQICPISCQHRGHHQTLSDIIVRHSWVKNSNQLLSIVSYNCCCRNLDCCLFNSLVSVWPPSSEEILQQGDLQIAIKSENIYNEMQEINWINVLRAVDSLFDVSVMSHRWHWHHWQNSDSWWQENICNVVLSIIQ